MRGFRVTPATWEAALERTRRGDAAKPNTMPNHASVQERARGYAAELLVAHWLESLGVEFVHNGGCDELPDFEVAGVGVGVRCCSTKSSLMHPGYRVDTFVRHLRGGAPWRLFVGYEGPTQRYLLLGAATRQQLLAGQLVKQGEQKVPGFTAVEDLRALSVRQLLPPDAILDGATAGYNQAA